MARRRLMDFDEIMSPGEVAEWLDCSDQHVRNQAAKGALPGKKIGGLWRFNRDALAAWFEAGAA